MYLKLIKDFVLTSITGFLIVSMSGCFELARAVTSCNDQWYTTFAGVSYKYSDKLANFTSFNGKTYAYAKAGLGQEKITTGVNNGRASLYGMQALIANNYPGASLPKITDGSVQKMLTDVFGPLITASGQSSIYIGEMNKNDGSGYVNMDGSGPASYYNWMPGQPNPAPACTSSDGISGKEPYTIMLPDGAWKTACDGSSAPLFEFQGDFDCAVPYTGTSSTAGTPASNISTGPINTLKQCDTANYDNFGLYGNMTYAITKNPMSWADAKALAETSGGKIVYIGNQGTNDFLVTQFGTLMTGSVNVSGSKAWIGMYDPASVASWCMQGISPCPTMPARFQWISDTSSYSNWSSGQPDNYCSAAEIATNIDHNCFGENWAAIASDGTWSDEGDHGYARITLKAIVQWKDQLSCTSTIKPPPTPPAGGDLGLATGDKMCTDSSKSDIKYCDKADPPAPMPPGKGCPEGYTLTNGSCIALAPCPNNVCSVPNIPVCPAWAMLDSKNMCIATDSQICPLEKVLCTDVFETPLCPSGSTLDTTRGMCQADPSGQCPAGYTWDKGIDKCVIAPSCPDNGTFNGNTDRCEKLVSNVCPPGYTYDAARDVCAMPVNCGSGATFSASRDRCETPPKWDCLSGYTYNSVSAKCEATPYCSTGTAYNSTRNRCESNVGVCAPGYSYNTVLDQCVANVTCSDGGVLNNVTNQCELASGISCPDGFSYNSTIGKCEQAPSCTAPGTYNGTYNLCLAAPTGATCSVDYIWNATYGTCIASPSCVGGSYNPSTNRCEVAVIYSCPDPSYGYNASTGRCEKTPACSGGSYNGTYNLCLQSMTPGCPSGYSFNSVRNRCEYQPPTCPNGSTYNAVLDKCAITPSTTTGYTQSTGPLTITKYEARGHLASSISDYKTTTTGMLDVTQYVFGISNGKVVLNSFCAWGGAGNGGCEFPDWNYSRSRKLIASQSYSGNTLIVTLDLYAPAEYCPDGSPIYYDPYSGSSFCIAPPSWTTCYDSEIGPYSCYMSTTYPPSYAYTSFVERSSSAMADISEFINCPTGYNISTPLNAASCTQVLTLWGNATGITDCSNPATYACTNTVQACPSGTSPNSQGSCSLIANPTCTGGNFDGGNDVCWADYSTTCPSGMSYDSAIGFCTASATCSNGLLDGTSDVCYQSATAGCPGGYTQSGGICIASASCAAPGALDGNIDYCSDTATFQCSAGYTYSASYGQCFQTANCGVGGLNTTSDKCETTYTRTCPTGYTLNGTICQETPSCLVGGSYNSILKLCDGGANVCASPSVLDTSVDMCYQQASCGNGGLLNGTNDKCEATATVNCSGLSWDPTAGACFSAPLCDFGAYNAAANECQATINRDCGSIYSWDVVSTKCINPVVCAQDSSYLLSHTIKYDGTLNVCVSDTVHNCVAGTTYNGLPILKCEAVPICNRGVFQAATNSCSTGSGNCPQGDNPCVSTVSDTAINPATGQKYLYCSPNACTTSTQGMVTNDDTTTGANDVTDDGLTDQYGNCLSTLYLFPGKDMRCRVFDRNGQINSYAKLVAQIVLAATGVGAALAGAMLSMTAAQVASTVIGQVVTAAVNAAITIAANVAIDAATGQLGQGTMMAAAMTAATAVMSMATAYYNGSDQFVAGATKTTVDSSTGMSTTVTNNSMASLQPSMMTDTAIKNSTQGMTLVSKVGNIETYSSAFNPITGSGQIGGAATMVTVTTMANGTITIINQTVSSTASSMTALLQAQAMQLADQWGPAMATGMLSNYSATHCCYPDKMGASCEKDEFKEAKMQHDKWCHVVGTYCSSKFLGWCVVEKQTSCCFNSMLGRIFHEQGRPQLKTFDGWGTPKAPKCRGFLPDEFQNLDFAQMDLSEYVEKIASNVEAITGDIQQYMGSVQTDATQRVQQQQQKLLQQNPNAL